MLFHQHHKCIFLWLFIWNSLRHNRHQCVVTINIQHSPTNIRDSKVFPSDARTPQSLRRLTAACHQESIRHSNCCSHPSLHHATGACCLFDISLLASASYAIAICKGCGIFSESPAIASCALLVYRATVCFKATASRLRCAERRTFLI